MADNVQFNYLEEEQGFSQQTTTLFKTDDDEIQPENLFTCVFDNRY